MQTGLTLTVLWFDDDLVELQVWSSNGVFAGTTTVYASISAFEDVATSLAGFPTASTDVRVVTLGEFQPGYVGGAVKIELLCRSALGEPAAIVTIRSDDVITPNRFSGAEFLLRLEAAAIDRFLQQLRGASVQLGLTISLPAAGSEPTQDTEAGT